MATTTRVPSKALPYLCVTGAAFFWACNYIVGGTVVRDISPASLVTLRWGIALLPLLITAQVIERPDWREVARQLPRQIPLSLLGLGVGNFLIYYALTQTTTLSASLLNAVNPVGIAVLAAVLLRERLTRTTVAGCVLALTGVVLVLTKGDVAQVLALGIGRGELAVIASVLMWVTYTVISRRSPSLPPITTIAVQAAITVAVMAPVAALTGGLQLPQTGTNWLSVIGIALFPSLLSYLLWNQGLKGLNAGQAGVFMNLNPFFVTLYTVLIGAPYTIAQLTGGLVIVAGVILTNMPAPKPVAPTSSIDGVSDPATP